MGFRNDSGAQARLGALERKNELKQKLAKPVLRALNRAVGLVGAQISRKGSLGRNWDVLCRHLKRLGFNPEIIVDVGVAAGTDDIYRHFPHAKYYLIEPLSEFEPDLKRLCSQLDAEYLLAAAGPRPGSIEINVHPDLIGSSVFNEANGSGHDGEARTVDVACVDDIVDGDRHGPRMMKVDVQGAELQVLDGAQQCLKKTDIVILETSLIGTMKEAPELEDIVSYMKVRGFVVFDMIGGLERPLDRSLAQVDLVFIPQSHPYRASRRWRQPG